MQPSGTPSSDLQRRCCGPRPGICRTRCCRTGSGCVSAALQAAAAGQGPPGADPPPKHRRYATPARVRRVVAATRASALLSCSGDSFHGNPFWRPLSRAPGRQAHLSRGPACAEHPGLEARERGEAPSREQATLHQQRQLLRKASSFPEAPQLRASWRFFSFGARTVSYRRTTNVRFVVPLPRCCRRARPRGTGGGRLEHQAEISGSRAIAGRLLLGVQWIRVHDMLGWRTCRHAPSRSRACSLLCRFGFPVHTCSSAPKALVSNEPSLTASRY